MRRRDAIAGAVLFLGALALRLPTTWSRPEHIDEAITLAYLARMDYAQVLFDLPFSQPHFPTYYLLLEAWTDVVGFTAANARLLSVLLGAASVPIVYLVGVELEGRTVGGVAGLLAAVSPFYLELSQRIRMYSLWGFLAVLCWLLFIRARNRQWSRRTTVAYLASAFVLSVTHYFAFLTVVAQGGVLLVDRRRGDAAPWSAFAAAVAAMTPAVAWVGYRLGLVDVGSGGAGGGSAASQVIGTPQATLQSLAELTVQFLIGRFPARHIPTLLVVLLALEFAIVAGAVLWRRRRDSPVVLSLWILVPLLVPLAASLTVKPVLKPRYVTPVALGVYLALGVLVTAVDRPSARGVLAGLVLAGAVLGLPAHYDHTGDRGWMEAADHLDEHAKPEEKLLTVGFFSSESQYQTQSLQPDVVDRVRTTGAVNLSLDCHCRLWVIVDTKSIFGTSERLEASDVGLEDYSVVDVQEISGRITIYELAPSTNDS